MVDQADGAASRAAAQPGGQAGVPTDQWRPPGGDGRPYQGGQGHWTTRLERHGIRLTRGPATPGPLRRIHDGQMFGGVAAGLAKRTGLSVGLIRVVIVVAALLSTGYLAMPYVLAWHFVPA